MISLEKFEQNYNFVIKELESLYNKYLFNDYNPFPGLNYYRLKQVDYNGDFNYSQIIVIRNNQAGIHCNIYAGETSGNFILSCTQSENSQAKIFNVDGRILKEIKFTSSSVNKIDLNDFSSGMYILRIDDGVYIQTLKLIKN